MPKPVFTNPDQVWEYIRQRSPEEAIRELHAAISTANACMEALAVMHPGATLLAGIICGQPCNVLAFSRSREADHFTPGAMQAAHRLARIVADLPNELGDAFQLEINYARERRRLEAETEQALRAAADGQKA
jgi:hypothetical protein